MKFTEPDSKYWQRHDDGTSERNISEPVFPRAKKQQNVLIEKKTTEWKSRRDTSTRTLRSLENSYLLTWYLRGLR
jgi:hypothetical protein